MKSFLTEVAEHILKEFPNTRELEIIVPNRRTGLFLRKYLTQLTDKTIWLPKITPIQDIFYDNSELVEAEDITLIYKLYKAFIKHTGSKESFDDFYYWGEIILNDFDDIDKYLVDAQKMFDTIVDIKEIDQKFDGYEEEAIEIIKKFWYNVNQAKISTHKQSFLELWRAMFNIYSDFKQELRKDNIAYQGMIYKDVAESISTINFTSPDCVVVGFNALNKCEKQLLNVIKSSSNTRFFWDADQYYLKDKYQEAGRFIRENIRKYPPYSDIGIVDYINTILKDIEVIMAPSPISQVKLIPEILDKWQKEDDFDLQKTAIVLGDENLLIPLMYSIPESIESYNVSMGFPVKNTMSAAFVNHLMMLQQRYRTKDSSTKFYFKDVFAILNHSFIKLIDGSKAAELKNKITKEKTIYVDAEEFEDSEILKSIFCPKNETLALFATYLPEICSQVLAKISSSDDFILEAEFLNRILARLIALKDCISDEQIQFESNNIYLKLVNNFMRSLNLAFEGEPLNGLQILGFLETRSLDFDRVIMLSLNEGVFPKTSVSQSLIPYNLRKFHELPSIEFKDSIFAYYFYRLLQRSKEIKIIYSSQSGEGASEASRFISQIKYELKQDIKFVSRAYKIGIDSGKINVGQKSERVIQKIREHLTSGVSPTAINKYLDCKFKYYLHYIEEIKEPDKLEEEEDAAFFGSLFHQIMQNVYAPFIGKDLIDKDFDGFDDAFINTQMRAAIRTVFDLKSETEIDEFENKIIVEIIKKYVKLTLRYDKKNLPLTIIELEEQNDFKLDLPAFNFTVNIKGDIDRVDRQGEIYRVLDYKTGKTNTNCKSISELFEPDRKYDKGMITQILLYVLMYGKDSNLAICPGIININNLDGNFDYRVKINRKTINIFDSELKDELKSALQDVFEEMLNKDIEFTQTSNLDNCGFCPYKNICNR
ncbi:MAG: PD-(D/E)XK nuclease family protein [Bacteroidales bacterium]|nr:PD-(D/E)XK nuclease family protein [Bacteroidales bacterium]MDD4216284.1 PD-(D/E)XK nuclease family protein [Bacteroidales bacterium]MDY0141585.1 PD-(D/E)XK nuclease family protein [Bacteroidales bacterium]